MVVLSELRKGEQACRGISPTERWGEQQCLEMKVGMRCDWSGSSGMG